MTSEFAIGVHALVYLEHKQTHISSEGLASNVCTNAARIRKVMAKLKKKGLVETKEGIHGGYTIGMPAKEITLDMVSDAVEELFIKASWKTGDQDMDCMVASGMATVMDNIYADMNEQCRNQLKQITIKQIEQQIFSQGKGTS